MEGSSLPCLWCRLWEINRSSNLKPRAAPPFGHACPLATSRTEALATQGVILVCLLPCWLSLKLVVALSSSKAEKMIECKLGVASFAVQGGVSSRCTTPKSVTPIDVCCPQCMHLFKEME